MPRLSVILLSNQVKSLKEHVHVIVSDLPFEQTNSQCKMFDIAGMVQYFGWEGIWLSCMYERAIRDKTINIRVQILNPKTNKQQYLPSNSVFMSYKVELLNH